MIYQSSCKSIVANLNLQSLFNTVIMVDQNTDLLSVGKVLEEEIESQEI